MTKSPIVLRRINKLIGQAMRQCQLLTGNARHLMKTAIKWLNAARRAYKRGCHSYQLALRFACTDIRIINEWNAKA